MSGDLTHAPAAPADKAAMSFGPALRLQRKCACGGDKCDSCSKKKKGLQAKLEVGASDDRFEQEADRAAAQVMSGMQASDVPAAPMQLQRVSSGASGLGEAPAEAQQVLSSPGSALDAGSRSFFESRFGHDFSRVRVHHGAQADASARSVGAKAYTVGSNVVFASGQYSPHSSAGRHLMAHELAHVVQQGQGGARLQRAQACTQTNTEDFKPAIGSKWRVLSGEEVKSNTSLYAAATAVWEKEGPKVYSSIGPGGKKDPIAIAPGTEVTVKAVNKPARVLKSDKSLCDTGSGYYQIDKPAKGGKTGHMYSPFLAPVVASAEPKAETKAQKPSISALKGNYWFPSQADAKKEPPNYVQIFKDSADGMAAGRTNLDPTIEQAIQSLGSSPADKKTMRRLLSGAKAPILYSIRIPEDIKGLDKQQKWVLDNDPLILPGANPTIELSFKFWEAGPTMASVNLTPERSEKIHEAVQIPGISRELAPYFASDADPKALEPTKDNAKLITDLSKTLKGLADDSRARFDQRNRPGGAGVIRDWGDFDRRLREHVQREKAIKRLLAAKPRKVTGKELDSIVAEQADVEPEEDDLRVKDIRSQKATMEKEQDRRVGVQNTRRKEAAAAVVEHRKQLEKSKFNPEQQLKDQAAMLMGVFGRGFVSGAEYHVPPDLWVDCGKAIAAEPGAFYLGVQEGVLYGAMQGIAAAFEDVGALVAMAGELGYRMAARELADLRDLATDWDRLKQRKEAEAELVKKHLSLAATVVADTFHKFMADPAFLSGPAFVLGEEVGEQAADWVNDRLGKGTDTNAKGVFVGEVIGRIAIEIILEVVEPGKVVATGAARAGARAPRAASKIKSLVNGVPEVQDVSKARKRAGKLLDEKPHTKKPGTTKPDAPDAKRPKAPGDADGPDAAPRDRKPDAKPDDAKAAGKAEPEFASEPLPGGHAIEINDRGICLCSEKPCPRMRKSLKKSLDNLPEHDKALADAESLAVKGKADPKKAKEAAKKGKRVYEDVAKADPMEKWRAPYRRDMPKLRKDYADELKGDEMLKRIVDDLEQRYLKDGKNTDADSLDLVLKKLHEKRSAGKPGGAGADPFLQESAKAEKEWARRHAVGAAGGVKAGDVAGLEVFEDLSDFFKSSPGKSPLRGAKGAAKDARGGLLGDKGAPGTADVGVQPHRRATDVRDVYDVTGRDRQSAHVIASSFMSNVKGYKRNDALTLLMEPEQHAAFDGHWKEWALKMRDSGKTHCTVTEMRTVMHEAIANLEKLKVDPKIRGALAWLLDVEIASLKLRPEFKLRLPFGKKKP